MKCKQCKGKGYMIIEDKLPNISVTKIQVNTNFKPQIEDGEDFRTEVIRAFHNAVHYIIEKYLTENDELEQNIIELMGDRGELPKDIKEFMDLGQISIQIIEEQSVDVKQKDLDEDEVKIHLSGKKIKIDKRYCMNCDDKAGIPNRYLCKKCLRVDE